MICLVMIVKNEAHVVVSTLTNLLEHVPITSWVICDTGSSDNTMDLIQSFFQSKNIPGTLHQHEWVDFAHNRTLAMECAFNTSDYAMLFDADDSIHGDLPALVPGADRYNAYFGENVRYERPLFVNNRKKWHYTGVLHEYLDSKEPRTHALLQGKYHICSGRTGARNANPTKYADDAAVLERAFEKEADAALKSRYCFYCAQSYRDAKQPENAVRWYELCLTLNGWTQEKYCACMQLGYLKKSTHYFCKASEYDSERIEGIVEAMRLWYAEKNHTVVNALYHRWRDYNPTPQRKLFLNQSLYQQHMEYLNSISAYYVRDYASGYVCCKSLLLKGKHPEWNEITLKNIRLYPPLQHDKKMMALVSKI